MKCFLLRALLVAAIAAANAFGQSGQSSPSGIEYIGVIPVVANSVGPGEVNWRSEVVLQNTSRADVEVLLAMPGATGQPFYFTTLSAGQTLALFDIVGEVFGLSSAMGPLVIQTFGPQQVAASSLVRGFVEDREVTPQVVPRIARPFTGMSQTLRGLQVTESHRTNVGLANLGDEPLQFALGLQVVAGRFVETTSVSVAPYTTVQEPLQILFPVLARGGDLTVVVEPSGANGFAYASVIENESNNGRFVVPSSPAPPPKR